MGCRAGLRTQGGYVFGVGVTVDLDAVVTNWRTLVAKVTPAQCGAVVKTDAYGLGAGPISRALRTAGCRRFFVAKAEEGLALRPVVGDAEILVMHGVDPARVADYAAARLIPVLNTERDVALWRGQPGPCWVQVDTGMNRLGFAPEEIPDLAGFQLTGFLSHLACADEPEQFLNVEQIRAFRALKARFPGLPGSLANSSGVFLDPACHADGVRPGYALYGGCGLRPVVHWSAAVLQVRTIAPGQSAGYGAIWCADRPTRVATVEVGYADGLPRALSGTAACLYIQGVAAPIIGRVSMDLTSLDVTDVDPIAVAPGTLVEVLGPHQTVDQLAAAAGTIGYTILTGIRRSLPRTYMRAG